MKEVKCENCAFYKRTKTFKYKTHFPGDREPMEMTAFPAHFCSAMMNYLPAESENGKSVVIECESFTPKKLGK